MNKKIFCLLISIFGLVSCNSYNYNYLDIDKYIEVVDYNISAFFKDCEYPGDTYYEYSLKDNKEIELINNYEEYLDNVDRFTFLSSLSGANEIPSYDKDYFNSHSLLYFCFSETVSGTSFYGTEFNFIGIFNEDNNLKVKIDLKLYENSGNGTADISTNRYIRLVELSSNYEDFNSYSFYVNEVK